MKLAKVTFILATLIFALPALANDGSKKTIRKEKKRMTKEIKKMKEAEINNVSYIASVGKFKK